MLRCRFAGWLALLTALVLVGCSTPMETFLQVQHRENWALQDEEIASLQFYISREVLARNVADRASASSVLVVPLGTPGAAVEVGPDWIRVSFQRGGAGVYFLALKTRAGDSVYWLATEVEGKPGLHAVKDLEKKVIRVPLGEFELIHGSQARLLVNSDDLQKLIEKRTHIQGRTPGSN